MVRTKILILVYVLYKYKLFSSPRPNFKAYILFGTVRVRFPDYWNMLTYILSLYSSKSCYLISAIIYMNIIYALYLSNTPPPLHPLNNLFSDYWTGMYKVYNISLSFLQMLKIELHRPGIEPGLSALQVDTLPKELFTLWEKIFFSLSELC